MGFKVTARGQHHRAELARLIGEHHAARGYGPSVDELAAALKLNRTTVRTHLARMVAAGVVLWDHRVARSLRLAPPRPAGEPAPGLGL